MDCVKAFLKNVKEPWVPQNYWGRGQTCGGQLLRVLAKIFLEVKTFGGGGAGGTSKCLLIVTSFYSGKGIYHSKAIHN